MKNGNFSMEGILTNKIMKIKNMKINELAGMWKSGWGIREQQSEGAGV